MESAGMFGIDNLRCVEGEGVEWYSPNGRALTQEERAALAKRRGICVHCGIRTHEKSRLLIVRNPVTDDNVHQGICIRCNPGSVPPPVRDAFRQREQEKKPQARPSSPRGNRAHMTNPSSSARNTAVDAPSMASPISTTRHFEDAPHSDGAAMVSSTRWGGSNSSRRIVVGGSALAIRSKQTVQMSRDQVSRMQLDDSGTIVTASRRNDSPLPSFDFELDNNAARYKALQDVRKDPDRLRYLLCKLRECSYPDGCGPMLDILQDELESPLSREAAAVLWRISADGSSQELSLLATTLVHSLRNKPVDVWSLGAWSSLSARYRVPIAQAGGVEVLLEVLENRNDDTAIFMWACRCLYQLLWPLDNLMESKRNAASVEEGGGISTLLTAMKTHGNESLSQIWAMKVCHLLLFLADGSSRNRMRSQFIDHGLLSLGTKLLRARSTGEVLFCHTCEVVSLLLLEENGGYEQATDCIPSLVRWMEDTSRSDEEIRDSAFRLLISLCNGPAGTVRACLESDAPKLLLSQETSLARNWAISRLLSVDSSIMDDTETLECMLSSTAYGDARWGRDSVLLQCALLNAVPIEVLEGGRGSNVVLGALENFGEDAIVLEKVAVYLFEGCKKSPENARTIYNQIGRESLTAFCQNSTGMTRQKGLYFCGVIISEFVDISEAFAFGGFLDVIATAWTDEFTLDSYYKYFLLDLLCYLTTSDALIEVPRSLVTAITEEMTSGQTDSSILHRCSIALRNLVLVSTNASGFHAAWAIDCLNDLPPSSIMIEEICLFLCAFASRFPNRLAIESDSILNIIFKLMKQFSDQDYQYHADGLASAALALSSVTAVAPAVELLKIDADSIDIIISSVYKVIENDEVGTETLACLLLVLQDISAVDSESMLYAGVIVVIIDIMAERERSDIIQQRGCRLLANLASSEDLQVILSIAQTEGVDMIVEAMSNFHDEKAIQGEACRALGHLCSDNESKATILTHGGIEYASHALKILENDEKFLCNGLKFLGKLSSPSSGDHINGAVLDTDVIRLTLDSMRNFSLSVAIQNAGLEAVLSMARNGHDIRLSIANLGGIDLISSILEDFLCNSAVVLDALAGLTEIVVQDECSSFFAPRHIKAVTSAMLASIENENVQCCGCGFLGSLLPSGQSLVLNEGGKETIGHAMRAHYKSGQVQKKACRALSKLTMPATMGRDEQKMLLATEAAICGLISCLKRFPTSEDIQENSCSVLQNLLQCQESIPVILSYRGQLKGLLEEALARYPRTVCADKARAVLAMIL